MFTDFWNKTLHDGVLEVPVAIPEIAFTFNGDVSKAASAIAKVKGGALEIELTQNTGIGDGVGADK